jgi:hypothetical protein
LLTYSFDLSNAASIPSLVGYQNRKYYSTIKKYDNVVGEAFAILASFIVVVCNNP